jgi:hypothetical protein
MAREIGIFTMTNLPATNRFASMTAAQVLAEQDRMLTEWAADDAARQARNAALLASFDR